MWITPKPFGAPALLGFWACGKAWDAPGISWGKRLFGAPARGFWRRGGRLDGSLREAVRNLAPKRAILAAPKAVIHIIPKSAFPQKWRKKPSSYRGFGGVPTNFPPGYPPIAPRRRAQAPSPKTAPKEAKRYTLQHYIILCQPTQIKGWAEDGKGFAAPGGQRYIFYIFCVREMHIRGRRRMHQLRLAERSNYRTSAAADPGTPPG